MKCYCHHKRWGYKKDLCILHVNPLERELTAVLPYGMIDGQDLTIVSEIGFEKYGAYESWGRGYIVRGYGIETADRHLEYAIEQWVTKYANANPEAKDRLERIRELIHKK